MNRTEMNRQAQGILKATFGRKGIVRCESCGTTFGLTFAHRQKRRHYRTVEELADFDEVILLCLREHEIIEKSKDKTKELFDRLRPSREE